MSHHCISSARRLVRCLVLPAALIALVAAASAQSSNFTRDHGLAVLKVVKDDIKKNYYDPNFHGVDLDARFKAAEEKMRQTQEVGQMMGIIAQAMIDLNDSHTFFLPPSRSARTDYGWQMQAVGDKVFVSAVKPGSEAEAKGLKVGDELLSVNGFTPTRENLWKMQYMFYQLRPQAGLGVEVRSPGGSPRRLDIPAKIRRGKIIADLTNDVELNEMLREAENEDRLLRSRYVSAGDDLLIWKYPEFGADSTADEMMGKARKHKSLILDLRGNPGGYEETLLRLIGRFFDHEVKVGQIVRRKETKPMVSKKAGNRFEGKVIVLIDSRSGSSAEILARVLQMEQRAVILGDRSAGAVMRAQHYSHHLGADTIIPYGTSVTDADLVMTDGKSLEGKGVLPDELILPTAADLAAGRDPVLARAAELLGVKLDAVKAGSFFPVEWRK